MNPGYYPFLLPTPVHFCIYFSEKYFLSSYLLPVVFLIFFVPAAVHFDFNCTWLEERNIVEFYCGTGACGSPSINLLSHLSHTLLLGYARRDNNILYIGISMRI